MASLDVTSVTAVLKEIYPNGLPKELLYKNAPTLAILPKDTEAGGYGKQIHVPIQFGDPQGRSATFANARTAATPSKYKAFDVTLVNDYGVCFIDGEVLDRTKSDRGTFVKAFKTEVKNTLRQLRNSFIHAMFRNGGGALGQISATSNPATPTITLALPSDVRFFSIGQILRTATTDGTSGAVKAGSVTLTAINRNTGALTASGNWSAGIGTVAVNDFIFVDGDFGLKVSGFDAWIPPTDPGATPFFGMDRSVDPMRLGGVRQDFSGIPIEEAVPRMLERMWREDATTDVITMHPIDWTNFEIALGSKVVYGDIRASDAPQVGFATIKVRGPGGEVDLISDPNEIPNVAHALQLDTWTVYSIGDIPKMLDNDGMAVLRNITSDGVEAQMVYRAQMACTAPGWNGRFQIGS